MTSKTEQIAEKAHEFLRRYGEFDEQMEQCNTALIETVRKDPFGQSSQEKIAAQDQCVATFPVHLSRELLGDVEIDPSDCQALVDRVDEFTHYRHETFSKFGIFITEMMRKAPQDDWILDTRNTADPNPPRFFDRGYLKRHEEYYEYERDSGLLSNLASGLSSGNYHIKGNVGSFFASGNTGAAIILDGSCGWRSCYEIGDGEVTINGSAGHELAMYGRGGIVRVNGELSSVGPYYTTTYNHVIHHNGRELPKKNVDLRRN